MLRRFPLLVALAVLAGIGFTTSSTAASKVVFAPAQGGPGQAGLELSTHHPRRVLLQLTKEAWTASDLSVLAPGVARDGKADTGLPGLDAISHQADVETIERAVGDLKNRQLAEDLGLQRWFLLTVPEGTDIPELVGRYAQETSVASARPDWRAFPAAVPNDPDHPSHWGHENSGQLLSYCTGCGGHPGGSPVGTVDFDADAEAAWDGSQGYGDPNVVIAILDTGVDVGHPDLNQVAGWDYGDGDSNPDDDSADPGHGTACAGVAAAIANNGIGPAGIAGGCSIMPLKIANSAGSLFFSAITNAVTHAADNGADVVSMSFGAATTSVPDTDAALVYAYNQGLTLLAATGNENASSISYPANHPNVIGVGASSPCGDRKRSSSSSGEVNPGVSTDPNGWTCDGERWWGSNYGSTTQDASGAVDLIAPTILPTTDIAGSAGYDPGEYSQWFNGTSCSTPYVAGVAALLKSQNPGWNHDQVRNQLTSTAVDVVNVEAGSGWDRYSGYGHVNAAAAVGSGGGGGPTVVPATLPYSTGFEGGSLDAAWTTSSTSDGRVRLLTTNGPRTGSAQLAMDDPSSGGFAQNEAWLHLDLSGETAVEMSFWWKEFGDETHAQDGVYFSDDSGASFVKVQDLNGQSTTNDTWQSFTLDVDALASSNGLSLNADFVIKLQQYDNYPIATDGHAYDDLSVTASTPPANTVTLSAPNGGETFTVGASTTITWSSTGTVADVALEYSTNAGGSWTTITSSTPDDGSYGWTIPDAPTSQGRVRVSEAGAPGINDTSNGNFTIESPSSQPHAGLPYSTGFESGSLDQYWTTASTADGRIQVSSANTPQSGTYHLTMDSAVSGSQSLNEAWLHLDLSGEADVDFTVWWKEFGDETNVEDGIYFSDDGGASFVKVENLDGGSTTNNTWQEVSLDLDALAAANGLSLNASFVIKLQQNDNYPIATDGFAFDSLVVDVPSGGGGGTHASLPYSTGFETGVLDGFWSTSSTNDGRIRLLTSNAPFAGAYHMTMDDSTSGGFSQNEAWLRLNLAGESQVDLSCQWKEFGDETHAQDGIYFSDDDGASFVKVLDLNGGSSTNNSWQQLDLDVDALAAANGLSLSATFVVKFQQYDNYPMTSDGFAFDDVSVQAGSGSSAITAESEGNDTAATANGPMGSGVGVTGSLSASTDDDWFYFDVTSAGNVDIVLSIGSSADLDWYLHEETDTVNWVARGYTTSNPESGSWNCSVGRYFLRVDGYNGATSAYTVTVTGAGLAD
ncbi:MAG: S8 family serine peptidase [Acidobacteriota bacterium]